MSIFRRSPLTLRLLDDSLPAVKLSLGHRARRWHDTALRLWGRIWCQFTCPSPQIETIEGQIQARLLSITLLLALPIVLWLGLALHSTSPHLIVSCEALTMLMLGAVLVAYGLSRTRHYQVAVLILTGALLTVMLIGSAANYTREVVLYFSFTALVVTTFWPLRSALVLIGGINVYVVVGLPLLLPDDALSAMIIERSFVIALSAVISVIAVARHLMMQRLSAQTECMLAAEKDRAALAVERQRIQILRQFVQNASHDIRTPLSSIRLSLELLDATLYEEQKPRLEKLRQQTHHLERILLDMLELSRLDATDQLEREPVDIVKLVTYVHGCLHPEAVRFNHTFVYEPAGDNLTVLADDQYLDRAIKSVVENALHYTNHGGTITLRTYAQNDRAVIEVVDNGIGIAARDIPLIFDRFYRVDSARNCNNGGAGLGLTITRHIIALHEGQIDVESAPGTGSIFRITLPLRQLSQGAGEPGSGACIAA